MVVLASAGGNDVAAIARLVQASPDRVREMTHRFNDLGMRSLDPQWAGGRPCPAIVSGILASTASSQPKKLSGAVIRRDQAGVLGGMGSSLCQLAVLDLVEGDVDGGWVQAAAFS